MRRTWSTLVVVVLCILAFLPATPGDAGADSGPSVVLSPTSALPASTVAVTGTGFPKRTSGTLHLTGIQLAQFKTDKRGRFSTGFVVPPVPGVVDTPLTANVRGTSASTPFTVLSLAPTPETRTAPSHVIATQGPTDTSFLYALVTWDRSDPGATGYEVVRDGAVIGRVTVAGDAWDDHAFTDTTVGPSTTYAYQVRATFDDGTTSDLSPSHLLAVRADGGVGSGRVFDVDAYPGTDRARAQAAVDGAKAAGGGIVRFGARTYTFDDTLRIDGADNVVLRGAGADQTVVQPAFAGDASSCGEGGRLITFTGLQLAMATRLSAPVDVGERLVQVTSTSDLSPGQRIIFYEPPPVSNATPPEYEAAGVIQDPGSGVDERHRWDANEITAVDPVARTVTFAQPFAQSFTTAVPWTWLSKGNGNGIERMTLQGRSSTESTYYTLVELSPQGGFTMADVRGRWANRNYLQASGYDIRVIGFEGPLGDPDGTTGLACKYKFSVWRAANFTFVGGEMGEPTHDLNTSFITTQRAQRTLVRHSRFWPSRTYAFSEHGLGSRQWIFENNFVAVGAGASVGAISLGHTTWGFSGSGIVRNNTFEGNSHDVNMGENSYEVRILDNVMRDTTGAVVLGYGWAGPDTAVDHYGSLRWTISRNRVEGGRSDGIVLGDRWSPWYPYLGVKDVIIDGNHLDVAGKAIVLHGDSVATARFQVRENTGTNHYVRPNLVAGNQWSSNADGVSFGVPFEVPWDDPNFG